MKNELKVIAHIKTDFKTKFGIPRQSGLVDLEALIVFTPEFRNDDALRGIEDFSHLWLIWNFSKAKRDDWSPTVRPPRLGGNKRVGVFATRSPFRPNSIGLSSVKLLGVEKTENGTVLKVSGADLMDGTPIYDIKPYLPYTDCHPDAVGGFADEKLKDSLQVDFSKELLNKIPEGKRSALIELLSEDPRPHYITDDKRIYGFEFANFEIKFKVTQNLLTV
ncbi:MAG: tRNA (N6-threonylcarbamoyladenosine(37)-N6)-methyltransferase TrmO, partial [Elusimicrobiaceae bacterium]|nr:tRNA (N6-threonylcarbamoyladenosine(37)-N6)-methyltransferase TrmO [Elusimicrobiaceae bacterium]